MKWNGLGFIRTLKRNKFRAPMRGLTGSRKLAKINPVCRWHSRILDSNPQTSGAPDQGCPSLPDLPKLFKFVA